MHDHDPIGDSWPKAPIGSLRAWDCGVMWREIETAPGVYDFSRLDAIVETAEKHDADVLLVLGQTPPFHAKRPNAPSFYGPGASSPPTLESWTAYVRALAERYAGRPVNYQVWNEANVKGFWRGTPAEMAELTKAAYDVVSSVTPRPKLVAPAFVLRLIGQRAWFDSFYGQKVDGRPVADYLDAVSLQLYPPADGSPSSAVGLLEAARVVLASHAVDKPVWNTEVNYGITGSTVQPAPAARQQANVAETLLLNAANRIERVYWYGWDQGSIVDTLLTRDGDPTLPGRTFRAVASWLVGGAVDSCISDPAGVHTCTVRRSDGLRRVYWTAGAPLLVPVTPATLSYRTVDGTIRPALGGWLPVGQIPVALDYRR